LGSISGGTFWAGIFFVTAHHLHFSPVRNLALAMAMGAIYALGARYAGALLAGLARRISPRAALAITLATWTLAALLPLGFAGEGMLWAGALLGAAASAITWPIVESYIAAGRHGARMRSAIGWFNVTWTPAVAVPLLWMSTLEPGQVIYSLLLSAIASGAALVALLPLPPRPAAHEPEAARAAVGREYPWLMRAASWLLPLSYVMSATLSPVLPHRLAAVGYASAHASAVAALWMLARFLTLVLMWRIGFWHGRWGTLAAAAALLAAGLATSLLAGTVTVLIVGLLLFGVGLGLTYYAALYYSLAVGHAAVEAGGTFEALIGVGYCLGPLLGIAGYLGAGARASSATVGLTALVAAAAGVAAVRPYLAARRLRGGTKERGPRV
jgi:hypothetical protein